MTFDLPGPTQLRSGELLFPQDACWYCGERYAIRETPYETCRDCEKLIRDQEAE